MATTRKTTKAPGQTIADELVSFLRRFVYLADEHQYDVLALYILHTWGFDYCKVTPYIYINSAERGSGKTTLLEVLQSLVRAGDLNAGITTASLYRVIAAKRPTLLVDEVDAIWSGAKNEDMRGILNSGYNHLGSVTRAFGRPDDDDGGLMTFSTFCPKVMAGIDNGQLPDTIRDRSITINLKRANSEQYRAIEPFYLEDEEDVIADLIDKAQAFVAANADKLMMSKENRPVRLDELSPRQNQISAPIFHLAAILGNGWYQRAKDAILFLLAETDQPLSPQGTALLQVRDWFHRNPEAKAIKSSMVAELTGASMKQIGVWFNAYGIAPATIRFADEKVKGYRAEAFADAFDRYLPDAE